MRYLLVAVFAAFFLFAAIPSQACTTMIATKGATADGSMLVAHSDDDELSDQRLIRVPARKQEGKRKIFGDTMQYPRIVTDDRGWGYDTPGHAPTKPLYELPYEKIWKLLGRKVPVSYAYFDGNYGIMNEAGLMMGECTNGAKFEPRPVTTGKRLRIFYSAALSRIALENCRTAREAVKLMGALIDEYGLYSTGETLLVGDGNEAWVFEMASLPNAKYHSAWVAKRVPDGEFFVAANEFRIREIEKDNPDSFLYSRHLLPGLKALGWWNEAKDGPVDWLKAVSPGEYNHPYYSLRRVWRVMSRVAPDLALSPWVENGYTKAYPFSVRPTRKLEVQDVFALYRDHYEGTEFDLTKGVAAGPYGDPHRFVGAYDGNQNDVSKGGKKTGAWERAISVFYQGYTFVCQFRPDAPEAAKALLWFGPDVSYTTVFTPFFAQSLGLPVSYQTGDPQMFDPGSAWWRFDLLANWSRLNFQRMTKMDIQPMQAKLETEALAGIEALDQALVGKSPEDAVRLVTRFGEENAATVLDTWRNLTFTLFAKYSDGYINLPPGNYATPKVETPRMVGYPAGWLDKTDYADGPTSYEMK